ncbi:N-(5'-phosphoribosyl)anthranilate isomerase [Eubacteriaceae bacterium CHKCI004]|nr:N-(5'-phosphoribosyl)anthranilate isomerase [Eubacteriaceae bacterium CHKCI004]
MKAKICGINSLSEMKIALDSGADAIGFLVGITHLAEDKIDIPTACELSKRVPPFVSSVAVTHLQTAMDIISLLKQLKVDTVQLHNDIDLTEIVKIRKALPYLKIIKSVSITGKESVLIARKYVGYADGIILDSRTKERLGGTGITHDWSISRTIVEESPIPVILAGGLTPDNLREAIETVHPYAVDVNSGVETKQKKDLEKVKQFVQIAHCF